eukprot:3277352-Rhodomonas_salina.2
MYRDESHKPLSPTFPRSGRSRLCRPAELREWRDDVKVSERTTLVATGNQGGFEQGFAQDEELWHPATWLAQAQAHSCQSLDRRTTSRKQRI